MDRVVRRKLEMGERIKAFLEAHPFSDGSIASTVMKFLELLGRLRALVVQEREGRIARAEGVKRQEELQARLRTQLIGHLRKVGELAAKSQPELAAKFQLGKARVPNTVFLTTAGAIASDAKEVRDALIANGMPPVMFDELEATVTELEKATLGIRNGRTGHVGARADLKAVAKDVVEFVGVLNGLVHFAYRDQPELLAAWNSARTVIRSGKGKEVAPADIGQPKSA